MANEKSAVLAN